MTCLSIRPSPYKAAAAALAAAWCCSLAHAGPARAGDADNVEPEAVGLERLFWRCDYMGTHTVLDMLDAQACSRVADRLRTVRFQGDFDRMLDWWRQRKPVEHAALERAGLADVARANDQRAPSAPTTAPRTTP